MRTFVSRLQEARELEALCQHAVEEVKRITGFGRVNAYRFDAEDNGWSRPKSPTPATRPIWACAFRRRTFRSRPAPIPRQPDSRDPGRQLPAVALVPTLNPISGTPLDLSFSALRSVSPVHLQYMRNMGTLASMSISIVIRDRLWGLISCHDAQPRQVSYQTRTACELLGRILALQIQARETETLAQRKLNCVSRSSTCCRPRPTATAWWRAFAGARGGARLRQGRRRGRDFR